MLYQAGVTAYDTLDRVHVVARVTDLSQHPGEVVLRQVSIMRGTGESDPRQWLKDALIQILETL